MVRFAASERVLPSPQFRNAVSILKIVATTAAGSAADDAADEAEDADVVTEPSWNGYPYLSPNFAAPPRDAAATTATGSAAAESAPLPPPHFVADCFFITAQLMHTCVLPAGITLPSGCRYACFYLFASSCVVLPGELPLR